MPHFFYKAVLQNGFFVRYIKGEAFSCRGKPQKRKKIQEESEDTP